MRSSRARPSTTPEPATTLLLVDRPPIRHLLAKAEAIASHGIAVVCADGTPRPLVTRLTREIRAGRRVAVLYLHDASTILYPFSIEPIATLVAESREGERLAYLDLGLPPLGASPERFGSTLPDAPIFELAAIPAAALVRYCLAAASSLSPNAVTRAADPQTAR
jgi:hypothetical protein